jgi:undecaprenyl-phosphate 4-deoxy-4-formamido-L-arabinose transferase
VLEGTGLEHEIIFVEDGGEDASWRILGDLQAEHPDRIVAVQLMHNYGQHNALMCGFRLALGEYVVTMDDDLQNPPEEIPKLLEAIRGGELDLVYGRYGSKKHTAWRNAGSSLVNGFYRMVFGNDVRVSSFRVIRQPLLATILSHDLNFTFIDGLLAWNTQRIGQVEVEHHPRRAGRSGYNLKKLLVLALNLFTNFSLFPLQIVSCCGSVVSAIGFVLAFYYLTQALLSNIVVPGYASIIIAVLIIGGTQLLALGIIGEYLGRLHLNVNRKPQYQVRTTLVRKPTDSDSRRRPAGDVTPVGRSGVRTRLDAPHRTSGGTRSTALPPGTRNHLQGLVRDPAGSPVDVDFRGEG